MPKLPSFLGIDQARLSLVMTKSASIHIKKHRDIPLLLCCCAQMNGDRNRQKNMAVRSHGGMSLFVGVYKTPRKATMICCACRRPIDFMAAVRRQQCCSIMFSLSAPVAKVSQDKAAGTGTILNRHGDISLVKTVLAVTAIQYVHQCGTRTKKYTRTGATYIRK